MGMSWVKAIDELRAWAISMHGVRKANGDEAVSSLDAKAVQHVKGIADKIEREVYGEWIRLPRDCEDVAIRPGDVLEYDYGDGIEGRHEVTALIYSDRWDYEFDDEDGDSRDVAYMGDFYKCTKHAKPREIEDVLTELFDEAHGEIPIVDDGETDKRIIVERYAEEIRDLLYRNLLEVDA